MKWSAAKFSSIIVWITLISVTFLPLVFAPITQDYYDTNKWMLLSAATLLLVILWAITSVRRSNISVSLSGATLGLGAITLASIISTIVAAPNKIEAILNPFGPLTFANLTMLSLVFPTFETPKINANRWWLFLASSSVLALIAIYEAFGIGKAMFQGVTFLANPLWTPTGSSMATLTILILAMPLLVGKIRESAKEKNEISLSLTILMMVITLVGLGVTLWRLVPSFTGTILPVGDGWAIMLEILKNPRNAIFGVGADNFLAAFSIGRPATLNLSSIWSIRFTTNSNMFFHLITIYGLLGGAAFLYFIKSFIGTLGKKILSISLVIALIALFAVPPNVSLLVVITFILMSHVHERLITIRLQPHSVWPRVTFIGITLLAAGVVCYGVVRSYLAETTFYRSITLAQQNKGTDTYNTEVAAIKLNPYISNYHIVFSQTNMALATSLAGSIQQSQTNSTVNQANVTHDRQLVAQLVQQAISESKTAISLNQGNILAWENLARVYSQLIGVAQGADNWAIAGYSQAIKLDPTNPLLYLELGSVYIQTNNITNAITNFSSAVTLKPNYANAYYNLANAYKLNNDITQAIATMKQAQQFVTPGSDDYKTVTSELQSLQQAPAPTPTPNTIPSKSPATTKPLPTSKTTPSLTAPSTSGLPIQ